MSTYRAIRILDYSGKVGLNSLTMNRILKGMIEERLKEMGLNEPSVEFEIPRDERLGDLSTPVAMSISKALRMPPRQIAEGIIGSIRDMDILEGVDIAGPGFINFTFSRRFIYSELMRLLRERESYLRSDSGKGKRVQIEYVSANPTGPLHLGHGRGAALGNALSNLLKAAGYEVEREYYINDAGRQVRLLGLSVFVRYQQLLDLDYPLPEDGYRGEYIEDIAREILKEWGEGFKGKDFDDVRDFFIDFSYRKMMEQIKKDLSDFGVDFDTYQSERSLYDEGDVERSIEDLKKRGHIYEKEGAIWFRATSFGDDKDRVIVKREGDFTYFASDIAYHRKKIEKGFDEIIDIWGADHHGYIPRIRAVIRAFGYPDDQLRVLLVQMVTLLRGGKPVQMSKRTGEFVTLREVIEEIGPDTTKFIFLTRRSDSHLEFDLESVKKQSAENPVFYVQYANARINSIFNHALEKGIEIERLYEADLSLLNTDDEVRIIKKLLNYPLIFDGAVRSHEPHRITFYLQELAGLFHPYYNRYRVVMEDRDLSLARLALCEGIRIVLREGLGILGVSMPERM